MNSRYWRYPRDILEPAGMKNDVNSLRSVEYRSGRQRLVRLPLAEGIICLISLSADEASCLRTNEASGSFVIVLTLKPRLHAALDGRIFACG